MAFRSKFKRIQINAAQKKESRKDSELVHEKVLQERKHVLEAAIVKMMKARKTMNQNELLSEVVRFIRFPCEFETIKQRIASLIEREYMKTDENDPKIYHYVA
mmetsp:Transcript_3552/g.6047  ORF Transcript_3552/g.6047 Transcript_3552/m.6047 type:complete len:103 (-) Transcript_3552:3-311(-)